MELLNAVPMWVLFLLVAIIVVLAVVMIVNYLKNKNLENIREDVYQLILKAEHKFKQSSAGQQKLKWVVSQARGLLPKWVQALVSEDILLKIIDTWFRGVKDLLDDGKMNNSQSKGN